MRSREFFGMVLRMCGALIASVLAGVLLLTAVYALPVSAMEKQMEGSARILAQEGIYPDLYPFCSSRLDNWTDATMLLIAAHEGEGTVLEQAMTGARSLLNSYQPVASIAARYLEGRTLDQTFGYARYWHGYLLFLKPLLLVTDYGGIRTINLIAQLLLDVIVLVLMFKRGMQRMVIPYLLTIGFLMPVALGKSLQYSSCFYAFSVGVLLLLLFRERWNDRSALYLFFGLGILTAFFDFLTYPIAAFGIPAVLWLCMKQPKSGQEGMKRLSAILISWGFGYGGMWAGKWVAASLLTENNVLKDALASVLIRTSHSSASGDKEWGVAETVVTNGKLFLKTPVSLLAVVFAVVLIVLIVLRLRRGERARVGFVLPLIILALLPVCWYMGMVNHSAVHAFFAHKSLALSAFAGLCLLSQTNENLKKT